MVSTFYFDTAGYRDHSAAKKVLSNAKLTWDLADGSKLNLILNQVEINADDPRSLTRVQWQANPKQVNDSDNIYDVCKVINQTQTGLNWKKPFNGQHEINAMVYAGHREVVRILKEHLV